VSDRFLNNVVKKLQKVFPQIKVKYSFSYDDFVEACVKAKIPLTEVDATRGFYDKESGTVYLNPNRLSTKTAIHEFAHVWVQVAKTMDKQTWNKGKSLVAGTKYEVDVRQSEYYKGMSRDDILEEALVRAIADKGMSFVEGNVAKRFLEWANKLYTKMKSALGINRSVDFANMSIDDYAKKVARELLGEIPLEKVTEEELKEIENGNRKPFINVDKGILAKDTWLDRQRMAAKRYFTVGMGIGDISVAKQQAAAKVEVWKKKAEYSVRNFNTAVAEHLKTEMKGDKYKNMSRKERRQAKAKLAQELYQNADLVLKGREATIPDSVRGAVEAMRKDINRLQEDLISFYEEKGLGTPKFLGTLTQSVGLYVNRSYAMYDIKDWHKEYKKYVSKKDIAAAKAKIKAQVANGATRSMKWETAPDGTVTVTFTNTFGTESVPLTVVAKNGKHDQDTIPLNDWLYNNLSLEEATAIIDHMEGREVEGQIMENWQKNNGNDLGVASGNIIFSAPTQKKQAENNSLHYSNREDIDTLVNDHLEMMLTASNWTQDISGQLVESPGTDIFSASILKKRKEDTDLDPVIRKVMGEYTDPRPNYVKTVGKLAELTAKGRMEQEMLETADGYFLVRSPISSNKPPVSRGAGTDWVKVPVTKSHILGKQDVWMHPHLYNAMYGKDGIFGGKSNNKAVRMLQVGNAWVKSALTIQKDDSQSRNFIGAWKNLWATGITNFAKVLVPVLSPALMKGSIVTTQDFKTRHYLVGGLMAPPLALTRIAGEVWHRLKGFKTENGEKMTKEDFVNSYLEAIEYNLIEGSIDAGVIKDVVERAYDDIFGEDYTPTAQWNKRNMKKKGKALRKAVGVYLDTFAKPYQTTDLIFKMVQWETEQQYLKKAYSYKVEEGQMTKEEFNDWVKRKAAETVRNEQPTYSNSSRFIRDLSRNVLLGSFVQFTAQMYRTRAKLVQSIAGRMIEANKETNKKAANIIRLSALDKAVGLMTEFTVGYQVVNMIAASLGFDDEEDDAIGTLSPGYSEHGQRVYETTADKIRKTGKLKFYDLQFIDPSSVFYKPLNAIMKGQPIDALEEIVGQFSSEEILAGRLHQLYINEDQYGQEIYNKEDTPYERRKAQLSYVGEVLMPGYSLSMDKMIKGYKGVVTKHGTEYDLGQELVNSFLGIKSKTRDVKRMYQSKLKAETKRFQDAKRIYTSVMDDPEYTPSQKKAALERANMQLKGIHQDVKRIYDAGSVFWERTEMRNLSEKWIPRNEEEKAGVLVSKWMVRAIERNEYIQIDENGDYIYKKQKKGQGFDSGGFGGDIDGGIN
jgi:hypothetical protein